VLLAGHQRTIAFALVQVIVASGWARAQTGVQLSPSFTSTETYDTNVLFSPSHPVADTVTRATPAVDARYSSPLVNASGHYAFEAERFDRHPELSTADGRQDAVFDVKLRPASRVWFSAAGEFIRTHTPGELNGAAGLELSRALAERVAIHPAVTRKMSRTTTAMVEYDYTRDRLHAFGGTPLSSKMAAFALNTERSARTVSTIRFEVRHFDFGTTVTTSQALIAGWTHELTHQIRLAVSGGPRLTGGHAKAEATVSMGAHGRSTDLTLVYSRIQTTLIGLAGTADAESATAAAQWERRRLRVKLEPGLFRTERDGFRSDALRVGLTASRPIGRAVSIAVAYDRNYQRGSIYPTVGADTLSRNVATVSLVAAPSQGRR
jgi:hypothetical protein